MSKFPFPITPELTAIAIAYRNPALIADSVLPYVPVGKKEFKYLSYEKSDKFTLPDTYVGRKSSPNQVEFGATEITQSVVDYGLDDVVPQDDIDNAPPNYNPLGYATETIMDLVLLDREKRVADLVFNASNYSAAANKATLAGSDQWSHASSHPIKKILDALDNCIMRPNVMVIGNAAWGALRTHADIVKAVNKTGGDTGIASRLQIAELFELEEILVGQGWRNTSKKGQTASYSRIWTDSCALIYRNRMANTQGGITFGLTARFGSRVAGSMLEPNIGLRGSTKVRAGESVKELILANDLGYLFSDCIA